jgi:glycosyltransferase involved in cell wall biosynthesis
MIKLTIIVSFHRDISGLQRLLESTSGRGNQEVIIVQDCDTDLSGIVGQFANLNISTAKTSGGWAGSSRNVGIKLSRGTHIIFCDNDDILARGYIKKIQDTVDEACDIAFFYPTSQSKSNQTGVRHIKYCRILDAVKAGKRRELYKFVVPWSKVYSRKFLLENELKFEEIIASNDVMFSTQAVYFANNMSIIDEVIYVVSENDNSLTKKKSKSVLACRIEAQHRVNAFLYNKRLFFAIESLLICRLRLRYFWPRNIIHCRFRDALIELYGLINFAKKVLRASGVQV